MDTTEVIATLALVVSVVSMTYTVVVDRRRPRLRVVAGIIDIVIPETDHAEGSVDGPFFRVEATNLGPGRVQVQGVALWIRNFWRRWWFVWIRKISTQAAVICSMPESPDRLPRWLEVGESLTLLYPADSDMITNYRSPEHPYYDCLYLYDTLGRRHWAESGVFDKVGESLSRHAR